MFSSNVTQTYNYLDASTEILVMLLGAFLLGCFSCWLLRRFFTKTKVSKTNNEHFDSDLSKDSGLGKEVEKATSKPQTSTRKTVANTQKSEKPTEANKETSNTLHTSNTPSSHKAISDFKIINGITPDIESLLHQKNIHSYSDLRDIDNKTLNAILLSSGTNNTIQQSVKTWSHQAALAAKGDWRKLSEYQDFIEQAMLSDVMYSDENIGSTQKDKDNFQKIKGIGPQIEKILNNKGIYSFEQLKKADAESLKEYISSADKRFKNNQTATWPHQANMAAKNQWKELSIYQEFMDDINIDSNNLAATTNKANHTSYSLSLMGGTPNTHTFTQNNKNRNKPFTNYKFESNELINTNLPSTEKSNLANKPHTVKKTDSIHHKSVEQDKQNNIAGNNKSSLPEKPPKNRQLRDSNPQKDDLKKIEGIGPKIEEVLNKANIFTFHDLHQSNRGFLKSLLNEAGPQYRMHEPETWPLQAEIAKNKDWDKLKKYQDFLSAGREKK